MSQMLESLLTPAQRAQAAAVDAAMLNLNSLLAERAVLNTATQALDVSRRAAFEAIRTDDGWRIQRLKLEERLLDPELLESVSTPESQQRIQR